MTRKPFDPLAVIPSAEAVRQRLDETLTLAERLRILLELAEQLRLPITTADRLAASSTQAKEGRPYG